jgi:hypothetical protein
MNCGNFETIITELARDQIVDAHLRESALEHPKYCAVCANRFANEMALTAGLHALSASTAAHTPSDKIETTLLEAFRNQAAIVAEPVTNDVLLAVKPARRWARVAMAAAAIIVIALTSIIVIAIRLQRARDFAKADVPKSAPSNVNAPAISQSPEAGSKEDRRQDKILAKGSTHKEKAVPRRVKNGRNQEAVATNNSDPTEGFISLTQGAEYMPLESGQIVKVEVPRAALLAIGLPVNAQRAGESIKAELLVGQDGIARAIRFLQ